MISNTHLVLHESGVPAGTEWNASVQGWLLVRVLQGEGCAFREKAPLLLVEGDTLVHAPGRPCRVRASQLGELRLQFFQISLELLTGTLTAAERQLLERAAQLEHVFPAHRAAASPFARQFTALSHQAGTSHTLVLRCELLRLSATVLAEHLPARTPQPNTGLTAKERFELLVTQMVESELQHQSPEDLARQCGCGVRHFSRLFHDYFGRSLVPERIEMCLQKAKQLLEESDAKIIDVALASGFNHVGLFSSRFKKRFGTTPSEWRKRQLKLTGKKTKTRPSSATRFQPVSIVDV